MTNKNKISGFTLLESLITLCILGIILSFATALSQHWFWQSRLERDAQMITGVLNQARTLAQIRGTTTTVCPAGHHQQCGTDWHAGLLIKMGEQLFYQSPALAEKSQLKVNRKQFAFDAEGFSLGTNGSFLICSPLKVGLHAPKIIVNRAGRVRTEKTKETCSPA